MTAKSLSKLELKLYNSTIKFLDEIKKEKYLGDIYAVIKKSKNKYGTDIGIQSYTSETKNYLCSLKLCEFLERASILFAKGSKLKPYDKKYRKFILDETKEIKEINVF